MPKFENHCVGAKLRSDFSSTAVFNRSTLTNEYHPPMDAKPYRAYQPHPRMEIWGNRVFKMIHHPGKYCLSLCLCALKNVCPSIFQCSPPSFLTTSGFLFLCSSGILRHCHCHLFYLQGQGMESFGNNSERLKWPPRTLLRPPFIKMETALLVAEPRLGPRLQIT